MRLICSARTGKDGYVLIDTKIHHQDTKIYTGVMMSLKTQDCLLDHASRDILKC
jgi:hypothetical protein